MMQLIEVNTPALAKQFITVNLVINKDNANYIRSL
jgi:hypothetical protein